MADRNHHGPRGHPAYIKWQLLQWPLAGCTCNLGCTAVDGCNWLKMEEGKFQKWNTNQKIMNMVGWCKLRARDSFGLACQAWRCLHRTPLCDSLAKHLFSQRKHWTNEVWKSNPQVSSSVKNKENIKRGGEPFFIANCFRVQCRLYILTFKTKSLYI